MSGQALRVRKQKLTQATAQADLADALDVFAAMVRGPAGSIPIEITAGVAVVASAYLSSLAHDCGLSREELSESTDVVWTVLKGIAAGKQ